VTHEATAEEENDPQIVFEIVSERSKHLYECRTDLKIFEMQGESITHEARTGSAAKSIPIPLPYGVGASRR
jgi:hypothetical protein